jgi:diguanylate cyclase (GGDEF)-like protein
MSRVLVIDDHPWDRALLVTVLGHAGYHVVEAHDGREGLALLERAAFDLVICDVLMPTMDGYEFVRALRAHPNHGAQKVVFYTSTFHEREARSLADSLSVTAILTKPSEPERILRTVTAALGSSMTVGAEPDLGFEQKHARLLNDKLLQKFEELDQANGRLNALTELSLNLASEHDPQRLLEHFCRGARELLEARRAVLVVRDRYNDEDQYRITRGFTQSEEDALMPDGIDVGVLGEVMRQRSTLHIVSADHCDNAALIRMPPWREALLAPFASLSEVYGWILLMDRVVPADYSIAEAQLLTAHAAHAGRIYENGSLNYRLKRQIGRLEDEITSRQVAEAQVDRLNRVYALLSRLNALIVRVTTRADLYRETCNIAVEQGRFVKAWILEHKAEGPALVGIAGCLPEYEARLRSKEFSESLVQAPFYRALVEQKKVVAIDDLRDRLELAVRLPGIESYDDLVADSLLTGSRSLLWLPIVVNGETVAVLALHAAEPAFFNLVERKPLDELAGDIGYALEHIARTEQLDHIAFYDALTDLANQRLVAERLTQQMQNQANDPRQVAVAVFDISRFTLINDAFGRQVGDRLLRQIASRLVEGIDRDHVGRLSGNTFAIAMYALRDEAALAHFVEERLAACFGAPFFVDGHELRCSAHAGVAIFSLDGDDAETLLHNAETAMIRAKKNGTAYLFYNQLMSERVAEQVLLESELRGALGRDEFVLHYQPKLDMRTLEVDGVEALMRWRSPRLGLVAPLRFIPILEEIGMIVEVGGWALRESARAHARWRSLNLVAPRVAVNVSAIQLRDPNFANAIIEDHGTALDGIDIEITESLLMDDIETNLGKLELLRGHGMNIAIDDFGTGYSSFAYLTRLPAQTLKIDGSFVAKIDAGEQHQSIVASMIALAHRLGMKVVAEGVETEAQATLLRELQCDTAQGYLYCRPIPFDELTTFLESRQAHT